MLIYFAMLIPLFTAIILYRVFKHKTIWWEFVIPVLASLFLCFLMKITVEAVQTSDIEWWTGAVAAAEYYEDWDERVSCRHPKYKTVTRTVNGRTETETVQDGYEHMYDVDYHPPYWQVVDTNGQVVSIHKDHYRHLVKKFGNQKFVELGRWYHSKDGDKYVATWDGRDETCEVCTTQHRYRNRIIAGNSVFKFPEPKSLEGLFEYPKIQGYYDTPFILGHTNSKAERKLSIWNARFGKEKQCRLLFLVYDNLPIDVALEQENHWQGGNKNEFIVAIGTNQGKIAWCHVISWTEQEVLKAEVKSHIIQQEKLDMNELVEWVGKEVREKFVRKQFADFDYITVEPPFWTVLLTFFLTLALNIGLSMWIIKNEIE